MHDQNPISANSVLSPGLPDPVAAWDGCPLRGQGICLCGTGALVQAGLCVPQQAMAAGDVLVEEGLVGPDSLAVYDGLLASQSTLADGRRSILAFHFPGELVLADPDRPATAEVRMVTDGRVCRVKAGAWPALRAAANGLDQRLLALVRRELDRSRLHVATLARRTPPEKLACFLVDIMARMGHPGDSSPVHLGMSRVDMADHLGLQSETVSRALSKLSSQGVIALPSPSRVVVRDLARLRSIAVGDAPVGCGSAARRPPGRVRRAH